jgi:cobalt/nickel transport system permease protein
MIRAFHVKRNFIEQSLMSAVTFIKDATLCEEHASHNGFLQSLDARIKMITFFVFLLIAISLKSALLISWLYAFCLILAVMSRIPLEFFLLRTWVFIPMFSFCIVIPALFSFVTPGEPVWFFYLFGIKFIITRPGLDGAILFVVRVATSVSLVVLLSLTTRHTQLLKVLRMFGIPQVFILTVSMSYRYLYLFAQMLENILTAIKSRVGVVSTTRKGQKVVAWNIANMWNRAEQMNEQVYLAMLSRGYTGEPRILKE